MQEYKERFDHSHMAHEVMDAVNSMLEAANSDSYFKDITAEEGYDDCLIYGLVKDGQPLYKIEKYTR